MGVGFLVAVPACLLLDLLALKMTGMGLMAWSEMLSFAMIASVFGGLGAWLAITYSTIKDR